MSPSCHSFPQSSNMATQFLRKFLTLFYRQPKKNEKAHAYRTVNGVFGDWATSADEDLPPPYTDSPKSRTHFEDERDLPPPSFAHPSLQICPHQTLSFENLQEVAKSLTTSSTDETIDALTPSCREHRNQSDGTTEKAKTVCVSSPGLLRGFGAFVSEGGSDPAKISGVALCSHWDLGSLGGIRGQVETAAELQQFLCADRIQLCPHKRISDSDVINTIFGFIKRASAQEVITGCDRCDTEVKVFARMEGDDQVCRVTTKRCLGTMKEPDDPVWIAQCGT